MKHRFRAWDTVREVMVPNVAVGDGFLWEIYPDGGGEELNPDTHIVMMDTGKKDFYGEHIYYGDIVKFYSFVKPGEALLGVVYFDERYFAANIRSLDDDSIFSLFARDVYKVGNKCENPELKEQK